MNNGILIFIGVLLTMLWSWYGFVVNNFRTLGKVEPDTLLTGERYPTGRSGAQNQGQEVYRANGCASCHTMQVRVKGNGADIERGWGKRNTVLRDFLQDDHVFLGQVRVGPDLAGIGTRPYATREWHLLHLWDPRSVVPNSLMPRYPYLFEVRKIRGGVPSRDALQLAPQFRHDVPEGSEVVPTAEANSLVTYLMSLQSDVGLFDAPVLTNRVASAAAPAAQTNETAETNAPAATNQ
ncbi:MAG TPA: cbb3-type cytochrome c oxidase subunit II [Verrucomicrobiae bacterium]